MTLPADLTSIGGEFGHIARRFDLCVTAQPETEGALFDSGRRSSSYPTFRHHDLLMAGRPLCAPVLTQCLS